MFEVSRSSAQPGSEVLLVASSWPLEGALTQALLRRGIHVKTAPTDRARAAVVLTAPDLVVLAGDAASDAGIAVLDELGSSNLSSVVPAVVLAELPNLEERLAALRHGAASVLNRASSVEATAERLARLAWEIPERTRETLGARGESALRDFADAFWQELRRDVPEAPPSRAERDPPLVFGGGRPLAKLVDEFVQRRGRSVVVADVQPRELVRSQALEQVPVLEGLRVALAGDDAAQAETLAQCLRAHGARVLVVDLSPSADQHLERLQRFEPSVLVVGQRQLWSDLLRRVYRDVRLRWTSLLVVEWERLCQVPEQASALESLVSCLVTLGEPERDLELRLDQGNAFETRLESTGPSLLLHALLGASGARRVRIQARRARVDLELSGGSVVRSTAMGTEPLEGSAALTELLALESGRVSVVPGAQRASAEATPLGPTFAGLSRWPSGGTEAPASLPPETVRPVLVESPRSGRATQKRPSVTARQRSRLPTQALAVAGLVAIGAASFGLVRLRQRADVVSTEAVVPPAPDRRQAVPRTQAELPATEAPPLPPANPHPSELDTDPDSRTKDLPAATNRASPSCKELLEVEAASGDLGGAQSLTSTRRARKGLVRGHLRDAQREYCRALRADPRNPSAHAELAELLLILRDGKAGLEQVRRALEVDPENEALYGLLGDAQARLGRYVEARSAWITEAQLDNMSDPDRALVRKFLRTAREFRYDHSWANAERLYRRVAVVDPSNLEAALGVSQALRGLGQLEEARKWADHAEKLSPGVNRRLRERSLAALANEEAPRGPAAERGTIEDVPGPKRSPADAAPSGTEGTAPVGGGLQLAPPAPSAPVDAQVPESPGTVPSGAEPAAPQR